jgi:hypothetical protein
MARRDRGGVAPRSSANAYLAGEKKSTSSWLTRSASSWCTQWDAVRAAEAPLSVSQSVR